MILNEETYHCAGSVTFGGDSTCSDMTYLLNSDSETSFEFSNVEIKLRSSAQNGTSVFVNVGESMITLQLDEDGFLLVQMNLDPEQDPLMIRSNHAVNDGNWHRVKLEFFPTNKGKVGKVAGYHPPTG